MEQFLNTFFLEDGLGWAVLGSMFAVGFGVWGSSVGIRIAAAQSAGILSEKPDLFTPALVLSALPGTQGFYGLICGIFIAMKISLITSIDTAMHLKHFEGFSLCFVGLLVGIMMYKNAVQMGMACASSINLVAKRPDDFGRSILFPALIETYAVIGLLMGILMTTWITS
jgi:V/A-type H+/Na+-transporting ATPase subunit K